MRRIIGNLVLLLLVTFPVWFGGLWLLARLAEGSQQGHRWPEVSLFYLLVLGPQLLIGGLVHQLLLTVAPMSWSAVARRTFAVVTAVVIPGVLLLFGGSARLLLAPGNLLFLGLGLALYAVLLRFPASRQA